MFSCLLHGAKLLIFNLSTCIKIREYYINDFLSIVNPYDLELYVTELDRKIGIVLPGDDDSAFIDLRADFEADAIVRKEDELGCVPSYF